MPNIQQFLDNTEPFEAKRGKLSIKGEAFLERISARNETYRAFLDQINEIEVEKKLVNNQLLLHSDDEWIAQEMNAAVPISASDESEEQGFRFPTNDEIEARAKEIRARIKKLTKKSSDLEKNLFRCKCERLAFLVASWDVTNDDQSITIEGSAIEKAFKDLPALVELTLTVIERGVFGPLVTPPDSTL